MAQTSRPWGGHEYSPERGDGVLEWCNCGAHRANYFVPASPGIARHVVSEWVGSSWHIAQQCINNCERCKCGATRILFMGNHGSIMAEGEWEFLDRSEAMADEPEMTFEQQAEEWLSSTARPGPLTGGLSNELDEALSAAIREHRSGNILDGLTTATTTAIALDHNALRRMEAVRARREALGRVSEERRLRREIYDAARGMVLPGPPPSTRKETKFVEYKPKTITIFEGDMTPKEKERFYEFLQKEKIPYHSMEEARFAQMVKNYPEDEAMVIHKPKDTHEMEEAVCHLIALAETVFPFGTQGVRLMFARYKSFDITLAVMRVVNARKVTVPDAERFISQAISIGSGGKCRLEFTDEGVEMKYSDGGFGEFGVPMPGQVRKLAEEIAEVKPGETFLND